MRTLPLLHNYEFHKLNSLWDSQFIWEGGIRIYDTLGIFNNFRLTNMSATSTATRMKRQLSN